MTRQCGGRLIARRPSSGCDVRPSARARPNARQPLRGGAVYPINRRGACMKWVWIVIACLPLFADSGYDRFDGPVGSIRVSADGVYRPGFMYWYAPAGLFLHPSEFVLRGVVSSLTPPRDSTDMFGGSFWSGRLDVEAVVLCRGDLRLSASRIRTLTCDGFDGLTVGDTVLVFMIPYEGEYAVPRRLLTNSFLGYKLPDDRADGRFDPRSFIELLSRGDAWDLEALNPEELRLWARVDARGVAEALIRDRAWGDDDSE